MAFSQPCPDPRNAACDPDLLLDEQLKTVEAGVRSESERQTHLLFETAMDAMVLVDDEGRYVLVNSIACDLFGRSQAELLNYGITDFVVPEQAERFWQGLQHPTPYRDEICLRRADGTLREVSYAATANFAPHRHLWVLRDITEHRSCLSDRPGVQVINLEYSRARNRAILEAMPDLLLRLKRDGTCLDCILPQGSQAEKFVPVHRHISEVLPPDILQKHLQMMKQALITGEVQVHEHAFSKHGQMMWEEVRIAAIDTEEVLVIVRDITQRKQAEAALQDSEERLAKRERYLAALVEVQQRLLTLDQEEEIYAALVDPLGQAAGASRAYIFTNSRDQDGRLLTSQRAEWCAPDIRPEIDNPLLQNLPYDDLFPRWATVLSRNEPIAGIVAEFPPAERQILAAQNIQSILVLPLIVQSEFFGFIGFDDCVRACPWEASEIALLRAATTALALALERRRSQAALSQSQKNLVKIVNTLPGMVFVKDSDGRFLLVNQATANSLKISTESLTGQLHAQVHPNQAEVEAMLAADRQVIETGQPLFIPEEAYTDVDGQIRYLQTCKIPIQFIGHPKPAILGIAIDITDRKIAEIAIQQQAERERLITRITNHLRRSLDLQDILNTTVTEVRQILENDRVLIYRLLPDGGGVVIAESIAAGWQPILRQTITDPCLTEASCIQPYIQGHFQNTADIEQSGLSECYVQLLKQLQVRANLVLPILQGDQVWGWLVAQQCNAPRVWQPEEVTLLQQLSNQVAIAIQQSELYQQVQHLNTTLELQVQERTAQLQQSLDFEALLKRITDKVRDSLDENQILQTAVQELASRIGVGCCDTGIYNLEQGTSTIRYEYTRSLASSQGQVIQMADYEAIYRQLQQGEHLQFCKYHDHRGWMAVLVCPIQDNQETFGDLWLFDVPEKQFNEQEVRLVQQVTNQCAIALRQARLYQKAQSQVQELERLNQLKDDFLSTVSHELRSPMSNIKMSVQMLAMSLGIMDAEAQLTPTSIVDPVDLDFIKIAQYVQILDQECQQEISLINDLLDLARLEGETTPIMPIEISLQSWLLHVIEPFLERTRQHKQQLRVIVPADLPPLVTDMTSLERILTELMHNACKYTPPGEGIKISAHLLGEQKQHTHQAGRAVAVLPASLPPYFQIQICNSGIEISPVECDRIFDKFYRIPSNDPWRYGGTGLGLALVKKLVEHLGGSIWAEGANGQTCFTIVLPQSIHGTPFCGRRE